MSFRGTSGKFNGEINRLVVLNKLVYAIFINPEMQSVFSMLFCKGSYIAFTICLATKIV